MHGSYNLHVLLLTKEDVGVLVGILAGVHPCGTITLLGELFGAESKGQVYGHLHSYLFDNESLTTSISKEL